MNAPNRTITQCSIPSANDGRSEWLAAFGKSVSENGTTRRAWKMLNDAGLETEALGALWTYSHPPTDYVENAQRDVQSVNRQIKALIRAGKVEEQKQKAGDPRAALFFDHYWKKHLDVLRSELPFTDAGVTVGDWALSRTAKGKGMPDLPTSRKAFASLGPRSPISDRKLWLFVLLCYAKNGGVPMGLERLTPLTHCADPDCELFPRTFARFLPPLPTNFMAKCL